MEKRILSVTVGLLLCLVTAAQAQVKPGSFSLAPFAGGYLFEGNQDLKHSPVYGLRAGYHFTEHWGVEGVFDYVRTKYTAVPSEPRVDGYGFGVEGLYHFMPESRLVPFVAVGAGGKSYNVEGNFKDRERLFVDYGAGLKYFFTESVALRADVRHVILPLHDNYNNLLYTLGIQFAFGGEKKAAPVVAQPAAAPAPAPAPPVQVRRDSDGDGVFDDVDRCPGTPAGAPVDQYGCPLDSDGDGVYDYLDKCPGTPAGVAVDQDGCPLPKPAPVAKAAPQAVSPMEKAIIEKGRATLKVHFDFDKAVVKPQYHDEIGKVAEVMKKYPDIKITIEGHTDSVGDAGYNQRLSQRRADAVKKVLIDTYGIAAGRLESKGYGETKPVATNATKAGRQQNRRVEAATEEFIIRR